MPTPNPPNLIPLLKTPGWRSDKTGSTGTLEDAARAAHTRHQNGEEPGLITQIEDNIQLGLVDLQALWVHLGLPM